MPSLMSRVTQFARSRRGREMMDQAMRTARDPRTRARIQQARARLARRR